MTPQEQPDSQARDELYELIVSEVDSYAAPEYESYYPSIKENLMPKIEDYAERLATKRAIEELQRLKYTIDHTRKDMELPDDLTSEMAIKYRLIELEATLTKEAPDEQ